LTGGSRAYARVAAEVDGGRVGRSGCVRSLVERRLAEETAWRVPGITDVANEIRVGRESRWHHPHLGQA